MASGDSVQQIKERLSIVDVVSPYVELQKAGKHLKGRCPFHSEKTPSFNISLDRGTYYCFGCSQGGDMFTFVQEIEGVDFKGALKILADKAGVELVKEDPQRRSEREQLYAALEEATRFFEAQLQTTASALEYLKSRAVTPETIARWRIGYAPGPPERGWRELYTHLKGKGLTPDIIQKAGLSKNADRGKEPYDVFRDRIMFPIFDPSGRVIAFSGRILSKDSVAPKYVNSPETELFSKSHTLYGYHRAKEGIRKYDFSLIVEGQFDVVMTHQAGYGNAVAVSGTALTDHHAGLLQRLSNRVVLALDADKAGIAAVKRSAEAMLPRGMDVKVAELKGGKDPADIVKDDAKAFKTIIGHSKHVVEFLLSVLKEESKDERTYKLKARDQILPMLLKVQSHIDRDHFVGIVADALGTKREAIQLELVRLSEAAIAPPMESQRDIQEQKGEPAITTRVNELATMLLVTTTILEEPLQSKLKQALAALLGSGSDQLLASIDLATVSRWSFTLESQFEKLPAVHLEREIVEKLREYALLLLRQRLGEAKTVLITAEQDNDESAVAEQIATVTNLQKQMAELGATSTIGEVTNWAEHGL